MVQAPSPAGAGHPPWTLRVVRFLGHGGGVAYYLIAGMLVLSAASTALFVDTFFAQRIRRDVHRLVAENGAELLEGVQGALRLREEDLKEEIAATPVAPLDRPYLVVSLAENRLWYKQSGHVLFATEVATGSGKILVGEGASRTWRFETPRGRLAVVSKEEDPAWVPPDWHYQEQAGKRGLVVVHLEPGTALRSRDGSVITVQDDEVIRRRPDGSTSVLTAEDGREIVADGKLVVPPLGSAARKYKGVLGTHRLNLGDGYALHGTNRPETIGRSVSHGCIRLRNEDIARLYGMVDVGTPVFIY
jgi:L,D-transpeptidase-like protein